MPNQHTLYINGQGHPPLEYQIQVSGEAGKTAVRDSTLSAVESSEITGSNPATISGITTSQPDGYWFSGSIESVEIITDGDRASDGQAFVNGQEMQLSETVGLGDSQQAPDNTDGGADSGSGGVDETDDGLVGSVDRTDALQLATLLSVGTALVITGDSE